MKIKNGLFKRLNECKSVHVNTSQIKKNSTLIVALSGGPDSVYLLHELKKLEKKLGLKLIAAHLNHGTRDSSDSDEKFCKQLCKKLDVTFESKKVKLKGVKNFEDTARTARYEFFDEIKRKYKADFIATAHHLNDSIETVLLNLTRGCSLQGLTGIKDRDDIIRPLANLKKEEILSYLKKHRIKFVVDPTNLENTFARNKVRNLILPVLKKINPGIEKNFAKNIEHFRKVQSFLEKLAKDWLEKNGNFKIGASENDIRFKISAFKKLDEVLQSEILTYIYKENTGGTAGLTSKQIENALAIILKNRNLFGKLGGTHFRTEYGVCTCTTRPGRPGSENPATFRYTVKILKARDIHTTRTSSNNAILLDLDKLDPHFDPANLTVRTWLHGDRLQPLGMKGTKKLQDFFTDKKIPTAERATIPIFLYKDEIVAVGTLTVNEKYKMRKTTKKMLKINIINEYGNRLLKN